MDQLGNDQDMRDTWIAAIIGQEHVQFWSLNQSQRGCICSPLHSFSLSTTSPGFQMWQTWLASSSQVALSGVFVLQIELSLVYCAKSADVLAKHV